jgi:hypothetical protein
VKPSKNKALTLVCLLTLSFSPFAQTSQTFDISTFQSPDGWKKQEKDGALIFSTSNPQKGTYAMITLYRSGESSGDAKRDFESDWQQFIVGQLGIKSNPQIEPSTNADGWEVLTGGAAFENEMGTSAVILHTFSGFGKTFSLAAIFNSQDNLPTIEAFVSTIKLRKPETSSKPLPANNDSAASILGTKWGRLLTSQNRTFEKVTYQFTRHYFSGIQQWNLVLQADRATERDGPFSISTLFSNAWLYAPITANNPAIDLPR